MKNDYHLDNDTLYGKGKLILDGEQLLDRKIALSDIESIEVESIDGGNTALFIVGIIAGTFVLAIIIIAIGCAISGNCFNIK